MKLSRNAVRGFNRPSILAIVSMSIDLAFRLDNPRAGVPVGVKFMIGQIGTAKSAARFLEGVRKEKDIADMVFVTTGNS